MANKKVRQPDPAVQHNENILADREQRIAEKSAIGEGSLDLGLGLSKHPPKNAVEFLRDEFDRKNFGDQVPTYTRILYGPDPLLTQCPAMKEQIEQLGLEEYANIVRDLIKTKRERAFSDPMLAKKIRGAIREFGEDEVAEAMAKRILKIPSRVVEIEADRDIDDEIFGKPLEDAVRRYGNPGMAPKFLSERCIGALGMRGYQIVKDERGDPVKVGTLIMGEIPIHMAERRRQMAARLSDEAVNDQAEAYYEGQQRMIRDAGAVAAGSGPLRNNETLTGMASENANLLGEKFRMGLQVERESDKT